MAIILVIILSYFISIKENYDNYLNNIENSEKLMINFCNKLRSLDGVSDKNIIYKNFFEDKIKKNQNEITSLKNEIDKINNNTINKIIKKKNNHKLNTHNKALKQLDAINKSKENIISNNKVKINLN